MHVVDFHNGNNLAPSYIQVPPPEEVWSVPCEWEETTSLRPHMQPYNRGKIFLEYPTREGAPWTIMYLQVTQDRGKETPF